MRFKRQLFHFTFMSLMRVICSVDYLEDLCQRLKALTVKKIAVLLFMCCYPLKAVHMTVLKHTHTLYCCVVLYETLCNWHPFDCHVSQKL